MARGINRKVKMHKWNPTRVEVPRLCMYCTCGHFDANLNDLQIIILARVAKNQARLHTLAKVHAPWILALNPCATGRNLQEYVLKQFSGYAQILVGESNNFAEMPRHAKSAVQQAYFNDSFPTFYSQSYHIQICHNKHVEQLQTSADIGATMKVPTGAKLNVIPILNGEDSQCGNAGFGKHQTPKVESPNLGERST
ncbi:predicted protein [Histoplasma capsulatum var. duboisii H88]|uniref:Predicted protein n=1 Tax=Ajellomyces capsulatus (strain H88) TaxID=544711 RepID=F0URN5_AJEC8|nr:predicted protein [Histoplasma capsulatum var. duboisii H88]